MTVGREPPVFDEILMTAWLRHRRRECGMPRLAPGIVDAPTVILILLEI
jgi:hypothetical protein